MSRKEMYHATYSHLLQRFPEKPWQEALSKLGSNPPIHRLGENLISYGLCLWELKRFDEHDEYERNAVAEAILYNAKLIEFYEALQPDKKASFKARWKAAFGAASDMRALAFEIFVYYSLKNYDWDVECKDDHVSGETYDYLASKKEHDIQVECKSFAYDKGLIINAGEASNLASGILKSWSITNQNPKGELCIVTVKVSEKLPRNPVALSKFCTEICININKGLDFHGDKFSITIQRHFDVADIQGDISSVLPVESNDIELQCIVSMPEGGNSRTCLRITTTASNAFWREFEKVCKDAAKKQLKQDMPAALVVHISNIESMKAILNDYRFAAKRNNIFNQQHLVSMVLISNSAIYEQDEYPFLFLSPIIKEFPNDKSLFEHPGKIFSPLKGAYRLSPR